MAATHILGDPSIEISEVGKGILEKLKNSCGGEKDERDIIDLTVTQFPQSEKSEKISVVYIKVTVWSDCKKVVGGIDMKYNTHEFTPRAPMIPMRGDMKKVIAGLEERFAKMELREITTKSKPSESTLPSSSNTSTASTPSNTSTPSKGSSWKSSTAMTFAAAAFTAFTIMKRNGDGEEEEDDEDDVCE